jgi:glycine cleavage system aminomethyltransferase T
MRLAEDDFLFTSGPGVAWADHQFRKGNHDAEVSQLGPRRFILQVQGPNSLAVMEQATGESLRDIGFMRFRDTQIAGVPLKALRQGMAGEIGYELHGSIEHAQKVFTALMQHGRDHGIRRLGGRTKMVNHVEACFPTPSVDYVPALFGDEEREFTSAYFSANAQANYRNTDGSYEYSDIAELYRTPAELGWGKMEMPRNLLGCVFADAVKKDGRLAGISTSRCYSYTFRQMLSLCVLDVALCAPSTEVTVIWGRPGTPQKEIRAAVAPAPYKKDNRRTDLSRVIPSPPR